MRGGSLKRRVSLARRKPKISYELRAVSDIVQTDNCEMIPTDVDFLIILLRQNCVLLDNINPLRYIILCSLNHTALPIYIANFNGKLGWKGTFPVSIKIF